MPKRISKTTKITKPKGRRDANQTAFAVLQRTIARSEQEAPAAVDLEDEQIRAVMRALGARGGRISGARRMENLSQEQRTSIASKAARARWAKKKVKS